MIVSTDKIIAISVSLALCVGLPVGLCIAMKRKGASMVSLLLGAATFLLFAMGLEQGLHYVVLRTTGNLLSENIAFRALYGGMAAAVFEEMGRFVTFKLFMKKRMNKVNATMLGVGHGGIEALLIGAVGCVTNLVVAIKLNNGSMALTDVLKPIVTTPTPMFFLTGIERVSAVILQLGMTLLVYRAVRDGKVRYLLLSLAIHFLVDAGTVLCANFMNLFVLEAVLLVVACVFTWDVMRSTKDEIQ